MKYVFICLFIPFISFSQSNFEQKLLGIWEAGQNGEFVKSERFNKFKLTFEFKENGICLYPFRIGWCGNEIPRIKSGKYILKDSSLTIEFKIFSKLIVWNLKILKISDKSLTCELIDESSIKL